VDIARKGEGLSLVVAVHGIQGTRAVWLPVAQALESDATFILPNLRGRGQAARGSSAQDYGLRAFASDLSDAIDAGVGERPYWLAGWSMGVSVALEYLSGAGARLPEGVILVSGTPAIREVRWFTAEDDESLLREIAAREKRLALSEAADHDAVAWTWQAIRSTDQRAVLERLDIPTLILHGSEDTDCPSSCAGSLVEKIRGAQWQIFADAGHSLPVTHVDVVANAIRRFLGHFFFCGVHMRTEDLIHFCPPGRLIIGAGSRAQLPSLIAHLGYRRGVFVTDRFFVKSTPWVDEYLKAASLLGIETVVFDGGEPDPTTTLCDSATRAVRALLDRKAPDHVIALGGGSNIDLAKALCITLPSGRPVRDFVGGLSAADKPIPLIALPTTAGTGSEATPGAILLDPDNATKVAVMDNSLRPQIALIDPEFTYTCPPRVTADAGIDALTHAIESYLTLDSAQYDRNGHPDPGYSGRSSLTMLFAREAISLCARFLKRAYDHGDDVDARTGMCYASIYAALSYGSAGLNAVHGIAYAVAGLTHRSHGTTNAVVLPYALEALSPYRSAEMVEIAQIFGISGAGKEDTARELCNFLRDLVADLGIPTSLKDLGVEEASLDSLTRDGLAVTRLAKSFPVPDVAQAYRQIVRNAYHGDLGKIPMNATHKRLDHV
jgi:alcohol dehydrogenase class IV/pimeloyl-ACP methyl ester carboxylesterase